MSFGTVEIKPVLKLCEDGKIYITKAIKEKLGLEQGDEFEALIDEQQGAMKLTKIDN